MSDDVAGMKFHGNFDVTCDRSHSEKVNRESLLVEDSTGGECGHQRSASRQHRRSEAVGLYT